MKVEWFPGHYSLFPDSRPQLLLERVAVGTAVGTEQSLSWPVLSQREHRSLGSKGEGGFSPPYICGTTSMPFHLASCKLPPSYILPRVSYVLIMYPWIYLPSIAAGGGARTVPCLHHLHWGSIQAVGGGGTAYSTLVTKELLKNNLWNTLCSSCSDLSNWLCKYMGSIEKPDHLLHPPNPTWGTR